VRKRSEWFLKKVPRLVAGPLSHKPSPSGRQPEPFWRVNRSDLASDRGGGHERTPELTSAVSSRKLVTKERRMVTQASAVVKAHAVGKFGMGMG